MENEEWKMENFGIASGWSREQVSNNIRFPPQMNTDEHKKKWKNGRWKMVIATKNEDREL